MAKEPRKTGRPGRKPGAKLLSDLEGPEHYLDPQIDQDTVAALSPIQRRFVGEYLLDLNGTNAAIRAGYSSRGASVQAVRLLANASIADAIAQSQAKLAIRCLISQQMVIDELRKIGFANMQDYVATHPDGSAVPSLHDLSREQWAAVSEITADYYTEGRGEDAREVKRVKLRLYDKRASLVEIGKHLGMFGANGQPIPPESDIDRRRALRQQILRELADLATPAPMTIREDGSDAD